MTEQQQKIIQKLRKKSIQKNKKLQQKRADNFTKKLVLNNNNK